MNKCTILFLVHIQSAVAELEKALDTPSNVMIYKQPWDYCAARIPGLLHNVMKFCERKIFGVAGKRDIADKMSYILFWEMLVLLQKGHVDGSNLAELLLRDCESQEPVETFRAGAACIMTPNIETLVTVPGLVSQET